MPNNFGMPYQIPQYPYDIGNQPRVGFPQQPTFMQQNQNVLQSQLYGRLVPSVESINPSEVPMDGSVSVFIKNDYSEVYLKSWNQNGTINTVTYKPPVMEEKPDDTSLVTLESINDYVKDLKQEMLERFDRLEKSSSSVKQNVKNKQEDKQ